jgi:hypothetical protein
MAKPCEFLGGVTANQIPVVCCYVCLAKLDFWPGSLIHPSRRRLIFLNMHGPTFSLGHCLSRKVTHEQGAPEGAPSREVTTHRSGCHRGVVGVRDVLYKAMLCCLLCPRRMRESLGTCAVFCDTSFENTVAWLYRLNQGGTASKGGWGDTEPRCSVLCEAWHGGASGHGISLPAFARTSSPLKCNLLSI